MLRNLSFFFQYTIISPKLDNLNPNTSVTEMLKIARCITNQPVSEKVSNKRHLCSDVDKRIKNLLYLDWLKEDMKDQPKLTSSKLLDLLLINLSLCSLAFIISMYLVFFLS